MNATTHDDQIPAWGTTLFEPGEHIGLVSRNTIGLVESGQRSTRDRLWQLAAVDTPIDDILDHLSADGLKALPSFALAQTDDDAIRIVARGDTRIEITHLDGSVEAIDPSGVRTWIEAAFTAVDTITISLGDESSNSAATPRDRADYFVLAGSVPAWRLLRHYATADSLSDVATDQWRPTIATDAQADDVAADAVPAGPSPVDVMAAGATSVEASPVEEEPPADRSATESSTQDGPIAEEQVDDPPIDTDRTMSDVDFDPESDSAGEPDAGHESGSDDPAEPPSSAEPAEADGGDDYDYIYGHTVVRSVEGAAVRIDADADGPLISAVPGSGGTSSSSSPTTPPTAEQQGDHDGLTISRADLAAMAASGTGTAPDLIARPNEVLAVMCAAQHPNPLHGARCRVCGQPLGTAPPVSVPRPPLGLLVFSNGERVVVDKHVLIGRNPRVSGSLTGELPRLVKIDDVGHGLSRTHAEVRLEGWQMLLEDLQSTNGTEVTLPGQAPRRLHAGEPVALVPGTTIDFGDEVQCTVEPMP